MLHAVVVPEHDRERTHRAHIDDAAARNASGVVAVMTHETRRASTARRRRERYGPLPLAGRRDRVRPSARRGGRSRETSNRRPTRAALVRVSLRRTAPEMQFDIAAGAYVPEEIFGEPASRGAATRLRRLRTRRSPCIDLPHADRTSQSDGAARHRRPVERRRHLTLLRFDASGPSACRSGSRRSSA